MIGAAHGQAEAPEKVETVVGKFEKRKATHEYQKIGRRNWRHPWDRPILCRDSI